MQKPTILFFLFSDRAGCQNRIQGVRRYAKTRGWHVQAVERCGVGGRIPVRELVNLWHPIGCIAECGGGIPEITRTALRGTPIVFLDECPHQKNVRHCVISDAASIGVHAAKELLRTGLRHFAFVGYGRSRFWSNDRFTAFRDTVRMHGYDCTDFRKVQEEDRRFTRHRELVRFLDGLQKPCGVFAAHDPVGEEVLVAAQAAGIAVPDEIAVIAVDDIREICENTVPPLSSISVDFERGGYLAAELLGELIDNPKLKPETRKYGILYTARRNSTGPSRRISVSVARAVDFIRKNADRKISLAEVAEQIGCSVRNAEKRFEEEIGHSVLTEITNVRIDRAKDMLRDSRASIEAITGRCGWASSASLRVAFKAATGFSPRAWRKAQVNFMQTNLKD